MIDVNELIRLSPQDREQLIDAELSNHSVPTSISEKLRDTYLYSQVINTFIKEYIRKKVKLDSSRSQGSILTQENLREAIASEMTNFINATLAFPETIPSGPIPPEDAHNLYELAGADKLAISNNVTRTLSTTMGSLWERIANISPYAINPELEFNLKLTGVDVIQLNNATDRIEYAQLKTQKNTLTGSQKNRSIEELNLHDYPIFCACFETKASWTFHDAQIPKFVGRAVWKRIGIDYSIVLGATTSMIKELEKEYLKLIS